MGGYQRILLGEMERTRGLSPNKREMQRLLNFCTKARSNGMRYI